MRAIKTVLFTLLTTFCINLYAGGNLKIKPSAFYVTSTNLPYPYTKWGYKDLLDNWLIKPQFVEAENFDENKIALVIVKPNNYSYNNAIIDLKGDILVQYKSDISEKKTLKKRQQALRIVAKKEAKGEYDSAYALLASTDEKILIIEQKEKARQDSILLVQLRLKQQTDSIANVKRIADSIAAEEERRADSVKLILIVREDSIANIRRQSDSLWLAKTHKITKASISGRGISLKKIKISGTPLFLRKDANYRTYTITRDDFNRYLIAHDGDVEASGVLDVKRVIYESNWGFLSDELFHQIEITKASVEISRGARKQSYGMFSFRITLNLDDIQAVSTDEEINASILKAIEQVEDYIMNFMGYYANCAHFVEPLFQVRVGGMEGITISLEDKKGIGASLEDTKDICNSARRKFKEQKQ